MNIRQHIWTQKSRWSPALSSSDAADLILVFGTKNLLVDDALDELRAAHADSIVIGCSTAGEINGTDVHDDTVVASLVRFRDSRAVCTSVDLNDFPDSRAAGESLARSLDHEGLAHVFVLSDGIQVNGSELVSGLASALPEGTTFSGGLSGDGERFESTLVLCGANTSDGIVAALGLYGENLQVGCASLGGWDSFGPERVVTRSEGNVVYELDGKPALDLYKSYLAEHSSGLPATGLLFPLAVRLDRTSDPVVRTILGIDESENSLTFAGDVPTGAYARLMKANFDRLVEGASGAAMSCNQLPNAVPAELAILISCVGRKMVLKQRVEDEVDAVREVLGPQAALAGFYSYGEISPFTPGAKCELHNQTMTITTLAERVPS